MTIVPHTQPLDNPQSVPYEHFQHVHEKWLQAEQKCKKLQDEIFLLRKIRRAPVLRAVDKDVLEEFHHVQQWGTVEDGQGNKRANYNTIAKNLHVSPDTVKRSAERLEKLQLADIREHQGPEDERERKYIQVKEDRLKSIDTLEDPEHVVPKQGGNRYMCMNENCNSTDVAVRKETTTKTTIHCNTCHHEHISEETEDTGWKMQIGHKMQKAQKQLAFEKKTIIDEETGEVLDYIPSIHSGQTSEVEKQLADHIVYTPLSVVQDAQKQVAFLEEVKSLPIWVCWRWEPDEKTGKPTKVPYIAELVRCAQNAKSNDLKTGRTYDQSYAIYDQSIQEGWKKPYDGIGLLCNGEFTGIDLDHCRNKETGEIAQWAQDIIDRFASLTYITPSEEGVRIIIQNKKPGPRCKKGNIEVYDQERFFTWTNNHLTGTPETIESRQEELDAFYGEVFGQDIPNQTPTPSTLNVPPQKQKSCIGNALEKARQASNGSGEKFIRLYDEGNWNGYYSQSEADQALFEILLYWTDGDVSTSDDLFKKSGLMRPKWNRDDYRKSTINGAMKFYLESQERRAS